MDVAEERYLYGPPPTPPWFFYISEDFNKKIRIKQNVKLCKKNAQKCIKFHKSYTNFTQSSFPILFNQ